MNIFNQLQHDIAKVGKLICNDLELLDKINVEVPKDYLNGDLSTNIAMIIAAKEGKNPREIALKFKELMSDIAYIAHLEVAGAGFINFTIKADKWHESIKQILADNLEFVTCSSDNLKKINIEYVSANPTGPLHIGHARGAVYGDALARLLIKCGYQVTREYYVNDAGSQIEDLTKTVTLRYIEALTSKKVAIPEGLYPGAYLIPVGEKLAATYGNTLLEMPESQMHKIVKQVAVASMLELIKKDLHDLGIEHDVFFSEQSLHDLGKIDITIKQLQEADLVYEGIVPPPKGKADPEWQERVQLLFRSTKFGDDQDRPIQKADGTWSYFAGDLAYAKEKIDRGFDSLVYVLGADHSGYVARIKAIIEAISNGRVQSDIKICQLVNFVEDGKLLKMSKRAGNFTTVRDVIEEVGADIVRFIMLTRKNDIIIDFDLIKVKEQSKENPVFYVQYAHVRTVSILANALENAPIAYEQFMNNQINFSVLSSEEEISLIKLLASWSKMLDGASLSFEPHRVAFYLINLAAKFHALWNLGKENNDYRFVVTDNSELTAARLALVKAVQKIIVSGLEIIGIQAMDRM